MQAATSFRHLRRHAMGVGVAMAAMAVGLLSVNCASKPAENQQPETIAASGGSGDWQTFGQLGVWDDGYSEMCYYAASDSIYGERREFTRVHLMNRQWMGRESGVKCEPNAADAVPVFKVVIAEQVPTQNYNYRYTATLFLTRPELAPFKLTFSSQEWCGVTFKHLRWGADGLFVQQSNYFTGENEWRRPADCVPVEALIVQARAAVAAGTNREIARLLPTMRSNKETPPEPLPAVLTLAAEGREIQVPAGTFAVRRVLVVRPANGAGAGDESGTGAGDSVGDWFDIEMAAPFRVVAFSLGEVRGALKGVERRPYWDRNAPSQFYEREKAP